MSSLVSGITGMSNGAATGAATGGSSGGGYGALIGGVLGGALGLGSGLLSSGGTSAAQQLDMLKKYYQPTKAGWSWAQLENQVAYEQYLKQLQTSASTDLKLSQDMNRLLPSSQVAGLRLAGLNPILAVLGSGFSPIQSSASASGSANAARLPGGLSKPSRHVNSAGSAMDFAKMVGGAVDAEVENRRADTENKKDLGSNLRASNDLISAQADKTRADASLVHEQANRTHADTQRIRQSTRYGDNGIVRFAMGLLKQLRDNIPHESSDNSARSGDRFSIPLPIDDTKSGKLDYWKETKRAINESMNNGW